MARSPSIIDRLPDAGRQALVELAIREYRDAADQAAYLIVEGLRQRGVLTDDRSAILTTSSPDPRSAA